MQSQVILLRSALGIENIIQTPCTVIEKKNNEPYQKLGPPPASLQVTHTVARVSDKAQSAGGVVCFTIGSVRTAIVGVEDPPGLEMGDESLNGSAQPRDDGVVLLVTFP